MIWKSAIYLACLASICGLPSLRSSADSKQESQPKLHCILGNAENIYALAFSPDDKRLLAAVEHSYSDANGTIMEWNVETGKASRKFDPGHGGQINSIVYSESGRFSAIGHLDGFVSVRDGKGNIVLSFMSVEGLSENLESVSISDDKNGAFVHTAIERGIVQTRSIPAGLTRIYNVPATDGHLIKAAMTRKGTTLVYCASKLLGVYYNGDFSAYHDIKSFNELKKPTITDIAVSDDSSLVMAQVYEGKPESINLALFDLKHDKLIKKWKGHDDPSIYAILPFHRRNWFATGNESGEIIVWDEKGEKRALLKNKFDNQPIAALALTRDNRFLASSGEGRPIVIWDLQAILGE